MPDILLRACVPEPLLAYLKALGTFRLVAAQVDLEARGWWAGEGFVLRTRLESIELLEFMLNRYRPTPIVSPWNRHSGFNGKGIASSLQAVRGSSSDRLTAYRSAILAAEDLIKRFGSPSKIGKAKKARLIAACRAHLPEPCIPWVDSAWALGERSVSAPLLGSGGNDGNLDFSDAFMKRLAEVLPDLGAKREESLRWLRAALLDPQPLSLRDAVVGQFHPGGVGGPNATQGFEGGFLVNPWDYVLGMEGLVLFAGGVARRLASEGTPSTAFPFALEPPLLPSHAGSTRPKKGRRARGEFWAPLWHRPASLREVRQLAAEGRVQWGRRQSRTAVDAYRAASTLGVDRGISSFQRYVFGQLSGTNHLAVLAGRVPVTRRPQAGLLAELDWWVNRVRTAVRREVAPASWTAGLGRLDGAITTYCVEGGRVRLQLVLVALGLLHRVVATTQGRLRGEGAVPPFSGLSPQWMEACDDRTPEFRVAAAFAASGTRGPLGSLRFLVEPVRISGRTLKWNPGQAPLPFGTLEDLSSLTQRRMVQVIREDVSTPSAFLGFLGVPGGVSCDFVRDFLSGHLDENRLLGLLSGLLMIRWTDPPIPTYRMAGAPPADYALCALASGVATLPDPGGRRNLSLEPDLELLGLLRAGDVGHAAARASRRLRTIGLLPIAWPFLERGAEFTVDRNRGVRLAASLLIPVTASHGLISSATWRKEAHRASANA